MEPEDGGFSVYGSIYFIRCVADVEIMKQTLNEKLFLRQILRQICEFHFKKYLSFVKFIILSQAFVFQPSSHALVFEYTEGVDLHEYLAMHSPQSDVGMTPKSGFDQNVSGIQEKDFMHMALQVVRGVAGVTN